MSKPLTITLVEGMDRELAIIEKALQTIQHLEAHRQIPALEYLKQRILDWQGRV